MDCLFDFVSQLQSKVSIIVFNLDILIVRCPHKDIISSYCAIPWIVSSLGVNVYV